MCVCVYVCVSDSLVCESTRMGIALQKDEEKGGMRSFQCGCVNLNARWEVRETAKCHRRVRIEGWAEVGEEDQGGDLQAQLPTFSLAIEFSGLGRDDELAV